MQEQHYEPYPITAEISVFEQRMAVVRGSLACLPILNKQAQDCDMTEIIQQSANVLRDDHEAALAADTQRVADANKRLDGYAAKTEQDDFLTSAWQEVNKAYGGLTATRPATVSAQQHTNVFPINTHYDGTEQAYLEKVEFRDAA
jgi:hypothetical protein